MSILKKPNPSSSRSYDGTGRQRDAERRRQRVIEAATELFRAEGYGATSIDHIAVRAEVSAPTVYAAFGSKAGVLRAVIDVAVGGDDQDIGMLERPEQVALLQEPDLAARLRDMAATAHRIHERSAPLIRLVASVAGADPAINELDRDLRQQMRTHSEAFVGAFPAGSFRADLSAAEVRDRLALYGSPAVWSTLVTDGGWTAQQYQEWLYDVIARTLLAPGVVA